MDKEEKRVIALTTQKSLAEVIKDYSDTELLTMYEELTAIEVNGIKESTKLRALVNSYYGTEWNSGAIMLPTVTYALIGEMARRWYKATKKSPIRRGRKKVD